ncbi:MAG: PKD domain-containing protein [Methanobacteriota archaeon]|nr:MAG: PKD domain-containing protein [Euryarchaeota archaeon]
MTGRKRIGVVLDGTASFDPDGDPLALAWTETSGRSVILSDATSDRPSFVPSSAGVYVFRLTVDDGDGGISSDEVTVVVPNGPPVAVAGPDTKARKYQTASLDASGVMVGDGDGGSSLDETSVYVWGLPPIATLVVSPVVAHLGELVRLDARGSVDPDGEVASYSFGFGDGTSSVEPTGLAGHVFGSLGVYNVSVRVTDIDGNASWAWSSVTVVAEEAQTVQVNWKPWIALVFVAVLAGIGWWSTSKSPHGSAKDFRTRARAFLAFTAPFLAAEAATGVFSMATGQLTIPPLIGSGVVVDGGILGFGIAVSILRGRRS